MKESQQRMMQHSEVKIRLLRLYLEQYLNILSSSQYIGDVNVYDLFCGEGIYENEGKGSPVVILEIIQKIFLTNKENGKRSDKINCLFNDIEKSKIEKLRSEIENRKLHEPESGNLIFSQIDYRTLLPNVIREINRFNKEKGFVFIDPYGYKEIKLIDIKKLMQANKAEVLLFLPTQFMFRFETKGTPECLIDFIQDIMPVEQWPASETGIDFIESLTDAFRVSMGDEYFVDSFIISRDKNQFFCLFFFTSHIYGFDRMLHAKWKIDEEEGRGWQYQSENSLFNQVEKTANTYKFEKKLINFLSTDRSNREVYEYTLHNGHLPVHTNEILLKLQTDGNLTATLADGKAARKSAFYLNYQAWKDEPRKLKLKIK